MFSNHTSLLIFLLAPLFFSNAHAGIVIKDSSGNKVALYTESHALVIGVSEYTDWPTLPGVKKDVRLVKSALEAQGFEVETVMNPDRKELQYAYRHFIDRYGHNPDNRLLFYYAGHGHTLKLAYGGDMGYIVPKDAPNPNRDKQGFLRTALDMKLMEVFAQRIQSKHALFLFDSCFSGSIFSLSRAVPENISYKTSQPVRQFITAGSASETVPDESIFRDQFIRALNGEGDSDKDGYVTGVELGEFLQKKVVNYSRGSQHPQYGKIRDPHLDKGDFVFSIETAKLDVTVSVKHKTPSFAPPPPKPTAPAPMVLQGHLQVNVNAPNSKVSINGESKGSANPGQPLNLEDLPTGSYTVQVEADGFDAVQKQITIQRGEWTQEAFELKRQQVAKLVVPDSQKQTAGTAPEGMVKIPGGTFYAGLDPDGGYSECKKYYDKCKRSWYSNEGPVHEVSLKPFAIDKYEVTQEDFERVMGSNPSEFRGSNRPVENVTWHEARDYCQKMGKRLPTETEWEKAAKGGRDTLYPWGDRVESGKANFCDTNCANRLKNNEFDDGYKNTAPVGKYPANGYGLYDMAGNVWEWTADWYDKSAYSQRTRSDPQGPPNGEEKVLRGGSWNHLPYNMRTANRDRYDPTERYHNIGFRCTQ